MQCLTLEARQDENLGLPEQAHIEQDYMLPQEKKMIFQSYYLLPQNKRPPDGHHSYMMKDNKNLPEMALNLRPINPNPNAHAIYSNFRMDKPEK